MKHQLDATQCYIKLVFHLTYFNSVFKWMSTLKVSWFKFLGFANYLEHVGSKVQSILLWNYTAPHPSRQQPSTESLFV